MASPGPPVLSSSKVRPVFPKSAAIDKFTAGLSRSVGEGRWKVFIRRWVQICHVAQIFLSAISRCGTPKQASGRPAENASGAGADMSYNDISIMSTSTQYFLKHRIFKTPKYLA